MKKYTVPGAVFWVTAICSRPARCCEENSRKQTQFVGEIKKIYIYVRITRTIARFSFVSNFNQPFPFYFVILTRA